MRDEVCEVMRDLGVRRRVPCRRRGNRAGSAGRSGEVCQKSGACIGCLPQIKPFVDHIHQPVGQVGAFGDHLPTSQRHGRGFVRGDQLHHGLSKRIRVMDQARRPFRGEPGIGVAVVGNMRTIKNRRPQCRRIQRVAPARAGADIKG